MSENLNLEGNSEIENALKEFEAKNIQQAPQPVASSFGPENSKMVQFVIKNSGGLIKERKHAEYVLLFFAAIIFGISLFVFFSDNRIDPNDPRMQPLSIPAE